MSKFAEIISNLMKQENLTTTDIKRLVGISTAQMGRYMSGYYEPSLINAIKLSSYFNYSLDFLVGLDNIPNRFGIFKNPDYEKFITRYYELLKQNKTNHNRVSRLTKFNRNNLIYWQKNKSIPTLDILCKLAEHLNTSVEYLIGRVD